MPIRAGASETDILLQDWLMPGQRVQSVVYHPGPGESIALGVMKGVATLPSPPSSGLGHVVLRQGEAELHVPVLGKGECAKQATYVPETGQSPEHVQFVGDATGWMPQDADPQENGSWTYDLVLLPGSHPYQWVVDGDWKLDSRNPFSVSNGMGGQNSALVVENPSAPSLKAHGQGSKVFLSTDGPSTLLVMMDDQVIHFGDHDDAVVLPLSLQGESVGRRHLRAWAANKGGISQDLLLPIEDNELISQVDQLTRSDWHTSTMYFLMVDRFADGNPDNNEPVQDPEIQPEANHQGGDLQGVEQRLRSGYFQDLGMNTVWISPVTQNAEGAWGLWQDSARTDITSRFSGYHGYWPVSCTRVDRRFGSQHALDALTESAHEHEMNVVLDYVANHIHEHHPLMEAHPDWTTDLYLPDGTMNTEKWDEHRLTTWFDTFMPTLDLERNEVSEVMSDSAAWWAYHSGIDGFRHDATKHIPESFWRKLTLKLKQAQQKTGKRIFQIGETYGSPDLIGSYLSSGMIDAQFDFNLYDKMVGAIAFEDGRWEDLVQTNRESLQAFGAHHLMGNITGNQDRPRFTSLADGSLDPQEDTKFQGWTQDIQHNGDQGYAKMRLLMSYLMSVPGIPCIYYGDEIADVGGNDPDNRRMMRFKSLNEQEKRTRDWTSDWAKLRTNHMAMLYGTTEFTLLSPDVLLVTRTYLDQQVHVALNRSGVAQPIDLTSLAPAGGQNPHVLVYLAGQESTSLLEPFGAVAFEIDTH
jgi:glycosidase